MTTHIVSHSDAHHFPNRRIKAQYLVLDFCKYIQQLLQVYIFRLIRLALSLKCNNVLRHPSIGLEVHFHFVALLTNSMLLAHKYIGHTIIWGHTLAQNNVLHFPNIDKKELFQGLQHSCY